MRFISGHMIPFAVALLLCWFAGEQFFYRAIESKPGAVTSTWYMDNLSADGVSRKIIENRLHTRGLLILGSSELTNKDLTFIPYNYFNRQHHAATALGHAGNQSFLMLCDLLPYAGHLQGAKVVVMLSPTWFSEYPDGTNLDNFAKNISEKDLYDMYFNANIDPKALLRVAEYIELYRDDFSAQRPVLALYRQYYKAQNQPADFVAQLYKKMLDLNAKPLWHQYQAQTLPAYTDSLSNMQAFEAHNYNIADSTKLHKAALFAAASKSNALHVSDKYYNAYIKGKETFKEIADIDIHSREVQDFKALLGFMQHEKIDAYFILQPMNPFYYRGLQKFDPIVQLITQQVKAHGFDLYNMFVTSPEKYMPGTLLDIMHLGENGWIKVDSAIIQHYGNKTTLSQNP